MEVCCHRYFSPSIRLFHCHGCCTCLCLFQSWVSFNEGLDKYVLAYCIYRAYFRLCHEGITVNETDYLGLSVMVFTLGTVSNDGDDGSKNFTIKKTSRFIKPCRDFSNSLKMSIVGEFPWK